MCTHTVTGQNLTFVYTFPRIPSHSGCGGSSSGSCAYCPSGKYKTSAGSEGCSDCPSGYTTLPGATALSECCPAGTHTRHNTGHVTWTSLILYGAGNSEVNGEYEWKPDVEPHTMPHNLMYHDPSHVADSRGVWAQKSGTCWIGFQNIASVPEWRKWVVFCSQGAVYAAHTNGQRDVPPKTQWEVSDWVNAAGYGVAGTAPAPSCEVIIFGGSSCISSQHVFCQHQSFLDDSCVSPHPGVDWAMDGFIAADCECCGCVSAGGWSGCGGSSCSCCGGGRCESYCSWRHGINSPQTPINPGIGFGTVAYTMGTVPHNDCLDVGRGDYIRGDYVNVSGTVVRALGTMHSTNDCSDAGTAFDDRADGTECSVAVGAGAQAAGIRRWKTWCFAVSGVAFTEYGYSNSGCSGEISETVSGRFAPRVWGIPASPNTICRSCGPGCSHRGWHCALNEITGTQYASDDCTGTPSNFSSASGVCQDRNYREWCGPNCAAGKFLANGTCLACPAHSSSPDGSAASTDCKCNRGYAGVDGGTCSACQLGTYKNSAGEGACASCPVGKYGATAGLTICLDCTTNATTLGASSAASTDCKCNRGYAGVDGGTCTACSPGTYKNSAGEGACASCPVGKYGATAGLTICLDCNTNATTLRGASTASSDCKCNEGYFLDIECTPCARGTYKSIVSNDDACTSCPVDTHTQFYFSPQASTASSACILAPKVTFSVLVDMTVAQATSGVKAMILTRLVTLLETTLIVVDWPDSRRHGIQRRLLALSVTATAVVADTNAAALAVTMTTPVANAFQMAAADAGLAIVAPSVSSTITLSDCHAHSARRSSGSLSHCTCNVGFTGPNGGMCTACVPGKFKTSTGTAVCKSCVAGTFATATAATSNLCQDCSVGKYSPSVGATNCLDCPADSSSPEKSDALADCLCNDPHYYMEGFICTPRGPMYQQEKILADFLISESTKRRFCIPPYFNSTLNLFIDGDSEVQPSSVGWWVRFDNKVWDDSAHTFRLGLTLLEGTTLKRSSLLMTRTTLHHGRLVSLPSARMVYEADVFNKGGAQITGEQFKIFSACSGAPGGPNGFITTDTVWPDEL